jgi:hypothetical protein
MSAQRTLDGVFLEKEIMKRGYAELQHSICADDIHLLVDRYTDFTLNYPDPLPETMDAMLPAFPANPNDLVLDDLDRTKDIQEEWHKYRTNLPGIGKPNGYTNRSFQVRALKQARGVALDDDPKEFYHYNPRHFAQMASHHTEFGHGPIPHEVVQLDKAFSSIHHKASELMVEACAFIEEIHPEINRVVTRQSLLTSPLRLLFYHPSDNEVMGAGHYDKSVTTLQLAESHEGLRISPDKISALQPVVRNANKAVFFAGSSLRDRIGQETPFQPGWHDIIKIDRLNEGRELSAKASEVCTRWALIFFANAVNYTDPGKAVTHSR